MPTIDNRRPMGSGLTLRHVYGGLVTYPAGATFGPRRMIDFELVWVIQGNAVYHADGRDHTVPEGAITMSPPGMWQSFTWDDQRPTRHAYVHFDAAHLPDDWPAPAHWPLVREMPDDDVVRPLLRYVLSWCRRIGPHPGRSLDRPRRALEALLEAYISGVVSQQFEHEPDEPEAVQRALRYVRQTLDEDPAAALSLDDVAHAGAVSPEHLCRLFSQSLGMGPMQMVRLSRLDRAMALVARSNLTIQQIADRCGFASPYHFSRRFKEAYGHPPTKVRQQIAAGQLPPRSPLLRRTF